MADHEAGWQKRYPGWALITGASSGLGACFARSLAKRGMDVILVARREERLRDLAQEIVAEAGVKAHVVPKNLTADAYLDELRTEIGDRQVSVLVNNAGIGLASPFHTSDPEHLQTMVRLNCEAVTMIAREFLPAMVERRNGAHFLLGSVAAFQPVGHFGVYSATKSYNLMLGEALWSEHRGLGIDTLVLAPGLTSTEFQKVSNTQGVTKAADPAVVVEKALGKLGKQPTFVPGLENKISTQLYRIFPRGILASFAEKLGRRLIPPAERQAYISSLKAK